MTVVRSKGARTECGARIVPDDALDALRTLLAPFAADPVPGLPPFQGGAAGYLAYDWGRVHERIPAPRHDDLDVPDVVLGVYDWVLAWDHRGVESLADFDRPARDVAVGARRGAPPIALPRCWSD